MSGGYIINLDTNKLEVWEGFQQAPDINNRYGIIPSTDNVDYTYYPCKKIKEIDLKEIVNCQPLEQVKKSFEKLM